VSQFLVAQTSLIEHLFNPSHDSHGTLPTLASCEHDSRRSIAGRIFKNRFLLLHSYLMLWSIIVFLSGYFADPRGWRSAQIARSEATLLKFFTDGLFQPHNVFLILAFHVAPKSLERGMSLCVGDSLVISPEGVQPTAQLMDQVVVMVFTATRFPKMGHFLFCGESHFRLLSFMTTMKSKREAFDSVSPNLFMFPLPASKFMARWPSKALVAPASA
jgi:hypothetical protein